VPDERLASEAVRSLAAVDHTKLRESSVKQPGAEYVEPVEYHPAVDFGHVALGPALDDFAGQAGGEGPTGEASVAGPDGQDGGRQGETGLDDRLGAERVADIDGATQGRRAVAGHVVRQAGDMHGFGRAERVPVIDPRVDGRNTAQGRKHGVDTARRRHSAPGVPPGEADHGPERDLVGGGQLPGVRRGEGPDGARSPSVYEDIAGGPVEQDGIAPLAGEQGADFLL